MPRADWKLVSKTVFSIPSNISEQAAIGTYFTALDSLITLHQRKCVFLFGFFQAFISMIFTASTFSWEQRKLSEIADKVTEKNAGLQYVETFTNSAEFGIISQRDFFDHDIAKLGSLDGYYIVKNEDFVYNPRISTSAPVGPINRNKLGRTGVMSPLYTVFRPHDVDTTYLEHFFKCAYWHSFMNFNGDSGARSDRFSIKDDVFFQMPIPLPYIDEQRKIGELLTRLDHLITLHQRECISFTARAGRRILTANKKRNTSSWEQRKLGEIGSVSMCRRIFKEQTSETGDIPFYKIGTFGADPDAFISRELFEEYKSKYPYPQKGDILISASGSIGRAVEFAGNNEYFQDSNIVWLNHDERLSNPFLKCFYSVVKWAGIEGSTIKRLYNDNILNTVICMPCDVVEEVLRRFQKAHIQETLATLLPEERDLIESLIISDFPMTEREYAKKVGKTQSTIHCQKAAILKRLKNMLRF